MDYSAETDVTNVMSKGKEIDPIPYHVPNIKSLSTKKITTITSIVTEVLQNSYPSRMKE